MSMCICKPWRGFHLAECPCQAAYEKHQRESKPSGHDGALAYMLIAAGYHQVSRKYRVVGTGPFSSHHLELSKGQFAAFRQLNLLGMN